MKNYDDRSDYFYAGNEEGRPYSDIPGHRKVKVIKSGVIKLWYYEPRIDEFSEEFIAQLVVTKGQTINLFYEANVSGHLCVDNIDYDTFLHIKNSDSDEYLKVNLDDPKAFIDHDEFKQAKNSGCVIEHYSSSRDIFDIPDLPSLSPEDKQTHQKKLQELQKHFKQ